MARELRERTGVGLDTYGPGPVSDEIAALITNPDAWIETVDPETGDDCIDLMRLTKAALVELAEEEGIVLPDKATKADIIELLADNDEEE